MAKTDVILSSVRVDELSTPEFAETFLQNLKKVDWRCNMPWPHAVIAAESTDGWIEAFLMTCRMLRLKELSEYYIDLGERKMYLDTELRNSILRISNISIDDAVRTVYGPRAIG